MRSFKHVWKVAIAGAALTGVFVLATNTHRTTQAAAPVVQAVVSSDVTMEMRPIVTVGAMGGAELTAANKTDW